MLPTHRIATHPGAILLTEFLEPRGETQVQLASELGIPLNRVNELVRGKRGVTAETALLLARHYGNSPQFWMNLQTTHDLTVAAAELAVPKRASSKRRKRIA
jgi:addiction module HigA family antidote